MSSSLDSTHLELVGHFEKKTTTKKAGIYRYATTHLKIDWIWHLLLKIAAGVIGPTLLYFSITKSHFLRFYIPFTPL